MWAAPSPYVHGDPSEWLWKTPSKYTVEGPTQSMPWDVPLEMYRGRPPSTHTSEGPRQAMW